MANPETIEYLSFRRTFTLLIVLVVLPSAGLSGFGVVAIINERAAVEKRLETVWARRLKIAQEALKTQLDALVGVPTPDGLLLELKPPDGDSKQRAGLVLSEALFVVEKGATRTSDARLGAFVAALGQELAAVPDRPVVFSIASTPGTVLVGAMRDGERVVGCQISMRAMETLVARAGDLVIAGDSARLSLEPVQPEIPQGLLARFVSGVSGVRDSALGPRELAQLTMPSPVQDFRLVAHALGEDPVAQASTRNRILYAVLLGVFYVALALGVIYTGRTLYREARVSRLKTDFVSLVSHELRTPLTSIRMFIEMLATGRVVDPKEMQTVLDLLSRETTRLSGMIESVLDWARIEGGRKQYHLEPVPVAQIVDAAVASFKTLRWGAAMQFDVQVAPGLPPVRVDVDAFSGALLNLLQNAFKYTGETKHIVLRAVKDDADVVFEVEDNGVGIPRRELKRVFERFYRVDNLLTRRTEGSGLGLSIAQRIVHAHGGRISVDSAIGRGSTFRIHLPATQP
jgi:two-component system, OmpR family, phosphate regulon sensor histidine kinase PhoR